MTYVVEEEKIFVFVEEDSLLITIGEDSTTFTEITSEEQVVVIDMHSGPAAGNALDDNNISPGAAYSSQKTEARITEVIGEDRSLALLFENMLSQGGFIQ